MGSKGVATVGLVACLAMIATLVVPYAVANATAVGVYYASGVPGAYAVGLIALLALAAFSVDLLGRIDAQMLAGATLVLGVLLVVLTGLWAATVPSEIVMGLSTPEELSYHRWLLVVLAVPVALAGGWMAVRRIASRSVTSP